MNRVWAVLALLALASCGADGEPVTPTASLNVGVSTSGAYASSSVGVQKGPWNLSLGRSF